MTPEAELRLELRRILNTLASKSTSLVISHMRETITDQEKVDGINSVHDEALEAILSIPAIAEATKPFEQLADEMAERLKR